MNKLQRYAIVLLALSATVRMAAAETRIAVVGPMTGVNASFGDQLKAGAIAAASVINAGGGVNGEELVIVTEDDVCDPRQAVSVANKVIADGITFVSGHFCSGATLPASEVYEEAGVVSITVSTNPEITERGFGNIFRISGRDDQQGHIAADYILKEYHNANIAILDDKSPFGKGIADIVIATLANNGVKPAIEVSITAGEKDFSAVLSRLKELDIDVVYFGGYHTEAGLIVRQAKDMGLSFHLVGADPLASSEYAAIAGDAAEGTVYTFGPDPTKSTAASEAVKVLESMGRDADGWSLYSYATVQLFAEAMRRAGSTEAGEVNQALRTTSTETAVGTVSFDNKGDNETPGFVLYKWSGGESRQVEN